MKRIFKSYESVILYLIPVLYAFVSVILVDTNRSSWGYYRLYETSLIMLVLYLAREYILADRVQKIGGRRIVPYNRYWNIFRSILVVVFFVFAWMSIGSRFEIIIIMVGSVLNYVLPKPILEGHFDSNEGFVHKGKIIRYEDIDHLEFTKARDVIFRVNDNEERIVYQSDDSKLIVYEFLMEKTQF